MRRHATDAGYSWRKWGEPLIRYAPHRRLRAVLFWLVCIDAGALAALLVVR